MYLIFKYKQNLNTPPWASLSPPNPRRQEEPCPPKIIKAGLISLTLYS